MRTIRNLVILTVLGLTGCNNQTENVWILQNQADFSRTDEPLIITRKEIDRMGAEYNAGLVPVLRDANNNLIPSQTDDINSDGDWDELAFTYSFEPKEEIRISLEFLPENAVPDYKIRTNIMMGISRNRDSVYVEVNHEEKDPANQPMDYPPVYQMEGPAWENDKIAFRTYFDDRNGKDIFGKLTEEMILHKVGATQESYHELQPWGMDVLKVGASLGSGALAISYEDSLIRLGATESAVFDIVTEGPVRSVFRLKYEGWNVGGSLLNLTEEISIWAGQYWFESKVTVSGLKNGMSLVSGLVNFHADSLINIKRSQYRILATHDRQSENKDMLGMAILIPDDQYVGSQEVPARSTGISDTHIAKMSVLNDLPIQFYVVAGWEKSNSEFASPEDFINLLNYYVDSFVSPIIFKNAGK